MTTAIYVTSFVLLIAIIVIGLMLIRLIKNNFYDVFRNQQKLYDLIDGLEKDGEK